METIQQLLNRIRWDDEFGKGDFEVGIQDRFEEALSFQPLGNLHMEKGKHFSFTLCIDKEVLTIPFHRIREVRKNGECIWRRPEVD